MSSYKEEDRNRLINILGNVVTTKEPTMDTSIQSYQHEIFSVISSFSGHNANYVIPKEFLRLCKDANSALILSQLVYWTEKGSDPEGWIYKSYDDWKEELFLSKAMVMNAVKKLKALGVIETVVRKIRLSNGILTNTTCMHYLVNQHALSVIILKQLESLESQQSELAESNESELPFHLTDVASKTTTTYGPEPEHSPVVDSAKNKKPSSSCSYEQDLSSLLQCVPEKHRCKTVAARLHKALKNGCTFEYIEKAIAYTTKYSKGSYTGYLGNCIDNPDWTDGFDSQEEIERLQADIDKLRKQQEQEQANEKDEKEQSVIKRKHDIVNKVQAQDPKRYNELEKEAADNLNIDLDRLPRGGKMKIRFELFKILNL